MRGSRGGGRGSGPLPLEFAKLNIADITGNEKISYFSYLCFSTVIRQTESILLKVGPPPPGKIFWIRACIPNKSNTFDLQCRNAQQGLFEGLF